MPGKTERRTITIAAQGYNDCFCLVNWTKQPQYLNELGNLVPSFKEIEVVENGRTVKKIDENYYDRYHLHYEEAKDIVDWYNREQGQKILSISPFMEGAKYNNLYAFVIDVDRPKDEYGNKEEVDTEAPLFKALCAAADFYTRSANGGYHFYFGIDKQKATPLFDEINLLCGTKNSYVCKYGQWTIDGRMKVDFFCDTFRCVYEPQEWDISKGLTDKTETIYELIKQYFNLTRPSSGGGDADNGAICIETMTEQELLDEMTTAEKRLIFADLQGISCECDPAEWFSTGIDIWHVFGDELGGSVFQWWSKPGHSYSGPGCATTWGNVCGRCWSGKTRLTNSRWRAILGLDMDFSDKGAAQQEEIQKQLKEIQETIQEENQNTPIYETIAPTWELIQKLSGIIPMDTPNNGPIAPIISAENAGPYMFRGLPLKWEHEKTGKDDDANHWIVWGGTRYKRDDFFKAIWGEQYKKVRDKVVFSGATADNVLRLSIGQRTALEYDALAYKYCNELVEVDELEAIELLAFFTSDNCTTAKKTKQRLRWSNGARKVATFGVGREQGGPAQHTWCYTKEPIQGGVRYSGVSIEWSAWAEQIEKAYQVFLRMCNAELWDVVRPVMAYQDGYRMTFTKEDREAVEAWVLGGCIGDFPLQGKTPGGDYEFTVLFDSDEVEYKDSYAALIGRNTEKKTELARARKNARIINKWHEIRSHLTSDKQEFTTADLNGWGYSKNVITRLKNGVIKEVGVKRYVLENI